MRNINWAVPNGITIPPLCFQHSLTNESSPSVSLLKIDWFITRSRKKRGGKKRESHFENIQHQKRSECVGGQFQTGKVYTVDSGLLDGTRNSTKTNNRRETHAIHKEGMVVLGGGKEKHNQ